MYLQKVQELRLEDLLDAITVHSDIVQVIELDGKKSRPSIGKLHDAIRSKLATLRGERARRVMSYEDGIASLKGDRRGNRS